MCSYIGVKELESEADFPVEMEKFKLVLDKIESLTSNKVQISADIVDQVQVLKRAMVLGENARSM